MTGVAIARAVRTFADIVRGRIPVIGQRIKIFHFDAGGRKGVAHGGYQTQGGQGFFVARTLPQYHTGTGRGVATVAIVAISVGRPGMTSVTGYFPFVLPMGDLRRQFGLVAGFMAILACRSLLDFPFGLVGIAVAVKFLFLVAIHAQHAFLIMDVRRTAVITCIFRIDATAVAKRAGFAFVLFNEFMFGNQSDADATHRRTFHMAIATGCVTAPAGFLEDFFIKRFQLFLGKPGHYTVSQPCCRIVQGLGIVVRNLFVAHHA